MTIPSRRSHDLVSMLVVALLVGLARYGHVLSRLTPLGDEAAYLCAFEAAGAGVDPYAGCPRFLYLPAIAHAGAALSTWFGAAALQVALRLLIVLGSAVVAVVAAEATGADRTTRCVLASLAMMTPPVAEGIELGNLSAPAAALTWLALLTYPRTPARAGAALASAWLVKPVALVALVALSGARGGARPAAWRAAAVALGVLVVGLAPWAAELRQLGANGAHEGALHNVSVVRVLGALGVHVPAVWVAVTVSAILMLLLRAERSEPSPSEATDADRPGLAVTPLAAAGVCGSLLALPVIWNHTLMLALPILAAATWRAWSGWRRAAHRSARADALLTLMLVVCADLAVLGSDAFGDLLEGDPWAALPLLLPLSAPAALAFYATRSAPEVAA